jgi:hypothetical protein
MVMVPMTLIAVKIVIGATILINGRILLVFEDAFGKNSETTNYCRRAIEARGWTKPPEVVTEKRSATGENMPRFAYLKGITQVLSDLAAGQQRKEREQKDKEKK